MVGSFRKGTGDENRRIADLVHLSVTIYIQRISIVNFEYSFAIIGEFFIKKCRNKNQELSYFSLNFHHE